MQTIQHSIAPASRLPVDPNFINHGHAPFVSPFQVQPLSIERQPNFGYRIASDQEDLDLVFHASWYAQHGLDASKLIALRARDNDMSPGIKIGDTLIVNTESTIPMDGHCFLFSCCSDVFIRRMHRCDGAWWIAADNTNPLQRLTDDITIVGQIVHKQSEII